LESIAAYRTEPKIVNSIKKKFKAEVIDIALGNNHTLALALEKGFK
jgi:hypothetical protein